MAFLIIYNDEILRLKPALPPFSNERLPTVAARLGFTKEVTVCLQKFDNSYAFFYLAHFDVRKRIQLSLRIKHPVIALIFTNKGAYTTFQPEANEITEGYCKLAYFTENAEFPFQVSEDLTLMLLECKLETLEHLSFIEPGLQKYIQAARSKSSELICSINYPIHPDIRRYLKDFNNINIAHQIEMNFATDEFLSGLLKLLTTALIQFNKLPHLEKEQEREYYKIVHFIEASLHKKLTIKYLCDEFHITTKTLNRRFNKYAKMSASEFIAQARIKQAKHLLVKTKMSIQDIAFEIGFDANSSFTKAFTQATSYSPSAYRKKYSQSFS